MQIREITKEDFPQLYRLWIKAGLWIRNYSDEEERFYSMYILQKGLLFVLIDDKNSIIGSILGANDGRSISIHRLVIDPACQHSGYGKMLVDHLEAHAKHQGIKKIVAQIHESNNKVLGFYEKLGYKEDKLITLKKDL